VDSLHLCFVTDFLTVFFFFFMKEHKQQELEDYLLKLEADCRNKGQAASLAESQVCFKLHQWHLYIKCTTELCLRVSDRETFKIMMNLV